jgi:hypothetical protein
MKVKNLNVQLVKLPSDIEVALFLIKEDLKSNRLLNSLSNIGFDESNHKSSFGTMVLAILGFEQQPDELYEFYYRMLDHYSEKVGDDNKKLVKAAFNLYVDLIIEKRNAARSTKFR